MDENRVELGDRVKDIITGFTGIVLARIEYLAGCVQFAVKPKLGSDGKMIHPEYVDEAQLEIVKKSVVVATGTHQMKTLEKKTGTHKTETPEKKVVPRSSFGGVQSDRPRN